MQTYKRIFIHIYLTSCTFFLCLNLILKKTISTQEKRKKNLSVHQKHFWICHNTKPFLLEAQNLVKIGDKYHFQST